MVGLYRVQICLLNNIVLLIIMDKLNPYQFLDDEAQNARGLTHVYQERQGNVVNDKEKDNHEKAMHIVHIQ